MNRIAVALVAAMLFVAAAAAADPLTPFHGPSQPVTVADVVPHYDENRENGSYSEWWAFVFRLDDGYWAYVRFVISNVGLGKGKAKVTAQFKTPDGQDYSESSEYEPGQWSAAKDHLEIKFGDNTISGALDAVKIHVKNQSFEADWQLANIAPPWKPGSGKAQYGSSSSRYYQFQMLAPVARVEGKVKLADDDAVLTPKGLIYGEHQLLSVGMHEQAKRWARYRVLDPHTTFVMSNIVTPDAYGGTPIQFAVLFQDGKVAFESLKFDVSEANPLQDPKKPEYLAPQFLELKSDAAGAVFHAVVKATKLTSREDFLENASAAERFVVSKFAKPIMYYFDGVFGAEVTKDGAKAEYKGKGTYYYTVVNL